MAQTPNVQYRTDYQPPSHSILDVELTFELADRDTQVIARSKVVQQAQSNELFLHGEDLILEQLLVDGQPWKDYQLQNSGMQLSHLPSEFELTVVTRINPIDNTSLEGLYKSEAAFCSQCEAEGFRRMTYFLDRPDVLAKYTTTLIADKQKYPYLLSNGNLTESGELAQGRHWVKWVDPHPKPSYLFAVVAGDFDVLSDHFITASGRQVKLEIFVDKGNLDRAPHAMHSLKNAMKWDEERFGLEYDLDIYMIVAVDFFNMGAMENKGLNVFNAKYVLANPQTATDADYLGIESVIGHEYFHNWTGNRVTCRDWFQLSLKEGLTVFRDQEFSSDLGSRAVNRIQNVRIIRGPQFAEDASPMSHPIRPEKVIEMNNFYTLTVYEKGSEVIRMLHTLLGETDFIKGVRLYLHRHDGSAATCEDFVCAMEEASGLDLSQFRLWYSQSGTPEVDIKSEYDAQQQRFTLHVTQQTPITADQMDKQPLHIPMDIELYAPDGEIIKLQCNGEEVSSVLNVTQAEQRFVFEQVQTQPIVSLFREFSAPVKWNYDYQDAELIFLMTHSRNAFACWDAGQRLLAKYIRFYVAQYPAIPENILPEAVLDAFRGILLSDLDPAFVAEMLTLPSHNEVFTWYQRINVEAICQVLATIKKQLAIDLVDELSATYYALRQVEYQIDSLSMARRALVNCCLRYLAHTEQGETLVMAHYQSANNMTDTIAALTAANDAQLSSRDELMAHYSQIWEHDGLVMDKWFTLQGSNPANNALAIIKQSMQHTAFSLKNPNRTRSLIGSFMAQNPLNFHAINAEGYQFVGEIIRELNQSNPQVASRLIDPLLKFRLYDEKRQALMKAELEKLKALDQLANDLYEKVTKALES